MQPRGRTYCKIPGIAKTDMHPPKGYINWWEDMITPNTKFARQQDKRDIQREINEYKNIQSE